MAACWPRRDAFYRTNRGISLSVHIITPLGRSPIALPSTVPFLETAVGLRARLPGRNDYTQIRAGSSRVTAKRLRLAVRRPTRRWSSYLRQRCRPARAATSQPSRTIYDVTFVVRTWVRHWWCFGRDPEIDRPARTARKLYRATRG